MRIAIVNDLRLATETLRSVVCSRPDLQVAWTAVDGREAIERCRADRPDLILMDMIMPVMDGVEATRRIMRECPCPIVVVTATVEGNASRVYEALGHGALDAVATPTMGMGQSMAGAAELLRKIEHVRLLHGGRSAVTPTATSVSQPSAAAPPRRVERNPVLAIGASTGGPQALAVVLTALAKPFPLPVLVVQHLGAEFAPGFIDWLGQQSGLPARPVVAREPLRPGTVYVAAREGHLVLTSNGDVDLCDEPRGHLHRPSVDVLFESLIRAGATGVAALLTGMGRDGAQGLVAMRRAGWWTIAQDQATSIVWGMPGEAVRLGGACETLPIDAIGRAIGVAIAREAWRTTTRQLKR